MKKKDVLKFYEQRQPLAKEAKKLEREIDKLKRKYLNVYTIVKHLEYLNVVDDIPVYLYETYGGLNVVSSFEESKRSAFLESVPDSKKYVVKLLKNDNNHLVYDKVLSKKQSLCVAAHWIATGEVL